MISIEVTDLTKTYDRNRTALLGPTFTVRPGRVTGFLGPNGAGKSTTLRLLLGLDRPDSGSATLGGRPYAALGEPLRTVGALLDTEAVHRARTAYGHLRWLAVSNRLPQRRVEEVLAATGLTAVARRRVGTFSLGMRQRLGIAAALLGDPAVLILDEPSNGLDPEGIVWIRHLLRRLAAQERTVLVSSHLMGETAAFADHLVILAGGRLLADTPVGDFLERNGRARVRVRAADPAALRTALLARGYGVVADGDGRWVVEGAGAGRVGEIAAHAGTAVRELSEERASLEEAYLALTAGETDFTATGTTGPEPERGRAGRGTPPPDTPPADSDGTGRKG
ncbi:ABC transporter ATP-binding protein [Streptomyces yaizuensis]|uniref:ATP-binding cassette domain-containing protein n=1 Tax=Streptomyces yaizuensis TaxID=2989713 RepID=A0ABQ5P2Z2_9ACTN|nr:ATP-binding cassette domain-containing protein [Streptomyces sp. YSPA8]GLF96818.1 ATP-binding cassette domain-containing protein [Streptomyces sp. YSPA8]